MPEEPRPADPRDPARPGDRPSDRDLATFAGQVAGLTAAGLPLASGLRALGDEVPPGPLRRLFHDVAGRLEAGDSLVAAVDAPGRRVPGHLRGLLLAGLRSGRLGEVLGTYVDAARAGARIRRKLAISLAYPALLLTAAAGLLLFLCRGVVPNFERIFRDFGLLVPVPTRYLLEASRAAQMIPWWVLLAAAGAPFVLWAILGRTGHAGTIPLVGLLHRWTALAELSRLLALLVEAEMPLPEALELAGGGVRDAGLAAAARGAARDVAAGHALEAALARRPAFPPGYGRLVAWGEANRALPRALDILGTLYEARARAFASFLGVVVGVLVTIIVLWGISVVIAALMLPMYQLLNTLSGGS